MRWFASATLYLGVLQLCSGWDYEGHRLINQMALALLPTNFPGWVREDAARERIAFLGGEMDRWRNTPHYSLRHMNHPDHYLDLEDLVPLEVTASQLSPFRYEFVDLITRKRLQYPDRFPSIVATNDLERTRHLPGFLPWKIAEDFARLKSAFSYLKAYEERGTPDQISNARANILYLMGVAGHAAGDAAQPLHTTRRYNGWVGDNPNGYTTNRTFHAWIDGGYLRKVGVDLEDLRPQTRPAQVLRSVPNGPEDDAIFRHACQFIVEQFQRMEPLYAMEKLGELSGEPPSGLKGKPILVEQLARASTLLSDLWLTAYEQAPPDRYLQSQLTPKPAPKAP
ncbi:MAG: hypothetical protein JNK85_28215 [Verrucomicrobiales bacterium]|nr:hypothetical protein [Verrucomicrobiales bacterium]